MQPGNDTASVDSIYAGVHGIITIGGSNPDFDSITQAVFAMAAGGVADSTRFQIRTGSYSESVTISEAPGMSCDLPVVFESETGDSTSVNWNNVGLSGAALVELTGADGIQFKNLKMQSAGGNIFVIHDEANCNTISHCTLLGNLTTSTSADQAIIYSPGDNDTSNTISNNTFRNGSYGIFLARRQLRTRD